MFSRIALALCCGVALGYVIAHEVVAKECNLLRSFYVGKTAYMCAPTPTLTKKHGTDV